ncbi:MAG: hypothetical protein Q8L71_11310 [Thiobacillus sp.]|nr:hypothetical protein [Thiobacillus sp.]
MVAAAFFQLVLDRLNERKNNLLLIAQVGLPANQFTAFRTILLDELGRKGFEKDFEEVLKQYMEWSGEGRHTHAGKEVLK